MATRELILSLDSCPTRRSSVLPNWINQKNQKKAITSLLLYGFCAGVLGFIIRLTMVNLAPMLSGEGFQFRVRLFIEPATWLVGLFGVVVFLLISWLNGNTSFFGNGGSGLLGGDADNASILGVLENRSEERRVGQE